MVVACRSRRAIGSESIIKKTGGHRMEKTEPPPSWWTVAALLLIVAVLVLVPMGMIGIIFVRELWR